MVVNVTVESISKLLPPGYSVDPNCKQPTVLFEIMELRGLPWLAGRGYNTWGIYASDIIVEKATEKGVDGGPLKGSHMLVLFESFTDPITTGREELGFSWVLQIGHRLTRFKHSRMFLLIVIITICSSIARLPSLSKLWAELPDFKIDEQGTGIQTAVSDTIRSLHLEVYWLIVIVST